ncbi:MAG: hypothetical protein IPP15_00565 [Saprospiraceae bacterium]|uniref:Uncharacterized protein n=1 Tax=Candidatus Opimibacter skivensis TaxID=2982028 RepID=A0A9D7SPX6_9BACT|nr:hypothetical protein [Candidatus Opimibacter skivensis]
MGYGHGSELEYTHPVFIGVGLSIFSGMTKRINLKLTESTVFKSGVTANIYQPS